MGKFKIKKKQFRLSLDSIISETEKNQKRVQTAHPSRLHRNILPFSVSCTKSKTGAQQSIARPTLILRPQS
jgi:hypothetical protein